MEALIDAHQPWIRMTHKYIFHAFNFSKFDIFCSSPSSIIIIRVNFNQNENIHITYLWMIHSTAVEYTAVDYELTIMFRDWMDLMAKRIETVLDIYILHYTIDKTTTKSRTNGSNLFSHSCIWVFTYNALPSFSTSSEWTHERAHIISRSSVSVVVVVE